MAMSINKLVTTCYGEKTYKHAVNPQKIKVKASVAKKQLIFLVRCINNNIWSHGLVVKSLDSQSRGPVFKITGWLQGRLSLSSF